MVHPYPDFDPECVVELIEIVRSGKIAERKKELLNHAWWIEGAILKLIVGEPSDAPKPGPDVFTSLPPCHACNDDEACVLLQKLVDRQLNEGGIRSAIQGLPLSVVVQLLLWVAELIAKSVAK